MAHSFGFPVAIAAVIINSKTAYKHSADAYIQVHHQADLQKISSELNLASTLCQLSIYAEQLE